MQDSVYVTPEQMELEKASSKIEFSGIAPLPRVPVFAFLTQDPEEKCALTLGSSLIKAYCLFCQVTTRQRDACDQKVQHKDS